MKKLPLLLAATLLSGTISVLPAFAEDSTPSAPAKTMEKVSPPPTSMEATQKAPAMNDKEKQEYKSMLTEASQMMGHVAIANIALLHNLPDEATENVQKALTIATKLEGQTAQLNADSMKLGKLSYHFVSGESHDYWLPVENNAFVVSSLDSEFMKSKKPKAAAEDAQIVTTKITLNTKQVLNSLEKASRALSAKDYGNAQVALFNAMDSTISRETISELPLVTAQDNLVLAKELLKSKDFDGASYALNHAKNALADYKKDAGKDKSAEAGKLQAEISALQKEMKTDKPSASAKIENHIENWIHTVEKL